MALSNEEMQELAVIGISALEELGECADPNLPTDYCDRVCRAKQLICGEWPQSDACARITALANLRCNGCSS